MILSNPYLFLGIIVRNCIIILFGPTAVGKTDFADRLALRFPAEIVNADMGQMYTPLTIGTAKPDWRKSAIPQHLFDIINEPRLISVAEYRDRAMRVMAAIWERKNVPILVGGSGFYLQSLFFPPEADSVYGMVQEKEMRSKLAPEPERWNQLYEIDPQRALRIHSNDIYRINRALLIYFATGKKPSEQEPRYQPPASYCFVALSRDRKELYARIDLRTHLMLQGDWIQETQRLMGTEWQEFLINKKIIGYDDIIRYLVEGQSGEVIVEELAKLIAQKTRNYAKRQTTFGSYLLDNLQKAISDHNDTRSKCLEFNLSNSDPELCVDQLMDQIKKMHCLDANRREHD